MENSIESIIVRTLLAFGYREYPGSKKRIYAKPVGYHLFCFNLDRLTWYNYFHHGSEPNKLCVYESEKLDLELLEPSTDKDEDGKVIRTYTPLEQMGGFIRMHECHTSNFSGSGKDFSWLTTQEEIGAILG